MSVLASVINMLQGNVMRGIRARQWKALTAIRSAQCDVNPPATRLAYPSPLVSGTSRAAGAAAAAPAPGAASEASAVTPTDGSVARLKAGFSVGRLKAGLRVRLKSSCSGSTAPVPAFCLRRQLGRARAQVRLKPAAKRALLGE